MDALSIADKGITLFTVATPNGYKISIALEELGLKYTVKLVDMNNLEQKGPEFLKVNPNGRIPAIVDHDNGDLAVWESGSILLYLADKYGKGKLIPLDDKGRSDAVSWLMWQMAGQGPMQGQLNYFTHLFPTKEPATVDRFMKETNRLYGVLDTQLSQTKYVAGDVYSVADIAIGGWALFSLFGGIDIKAYVHVDKWLQDFRLRPAVIKGMASPVCTNVMLVPMLEASVHPAKYADFLAAVHAKQALAA